MGFVIYGFSNKRVKYKYQEGVDETLIQSLDIPSTTNFISFTECGFSRKNVTF